MNKSFLALLALSTVAGSLEARELWCEQCEPQPEVCDEHLFVERSQIFGSVEFLWWSTKAPALEYAIARKDAATANTTFADGCYQVADYEWRPGFRVGMMYYRCPRYWELSADYTWFYDRSRESTNAPVNPARQTATAGPFSTATSLIGLHYHLGDLYFSRVFDPNPHLRVRLQGGFTVAHLKQRWDLDYTNTLGQVEHVDEDWRFFGGGFRLGLRSDWFWGCQFYLTGKASFATLIGSYKNTEFQTLVTSNQLLSDAQYDDHRLAVHGQIMVGPSWQVPCDCWSFELFAGWEFNVWSNVHERIRTQFNSAASSKEVYHANGLLGLQGFTLRMTLGF